MGCACCDSSGKEVKVSFCPKCKSRDVRYVFGLGNLFGVMPKMRCMSCGFSNPSFPVLEISEKNLKKAVGKIKSRVKSQKSKVKSQKSRVKTGVAKRKVKKKVVRKKKVVKKK